MIARLKDEHDRLRIIADRLDPYLADSIAPIDLEFSRLRWMLLRELSLHLATEGQAMSAWQARTGRRLEQFDRSLDDAFAQHVVEWSGASISSAWGRYRVASKCLLTRLRARMAFEETSVLPVMAAWGSARA